MEFRSTKAERKQVLIMQLYDILSLDMDQRHEIDNRSKHDGYSAKSANSSLVFNYLNKPIRLSGGGKK